MQEHLNWYQKKRAKLPNKHQYNRTPLMQFLATHVWWTCNHISYCVCVCVFHSFTCTGSLCILWAKVMAKGSLIWFTSSGRKDGNPPTPPPPQPPRPETLKGGDFLGPHWWSGNPNARDTAIFAQYTWRDPSQLASRENYVTKITTLCNSKNSLLFLRH